jgi:hypothetical protein
MNSVNLIPAKYRDARRRQRRWRAWMLVCGTYAIVLALGYVGVAGALGDGGSTSAELARTRRQVEDLSRVGAMLKIQLRDARIKLAVAKTVGEQADWSLLLAVLGKLASEDIVLRSCHLETVAERPVAAANGKPATQPAVNVTRYNLVLVGYGKAQADVTSFVLRLEKLGLFDHVDLAQSTREAVATGEATAFRVECAMHNRLPAFGVAGGER